MVLQGFDRNGQFKGEAGKIREDGLVAISRAGWQVAKAEPRCDVVSIFNWGRENIKNGEHIGGGSLWYPKLQAEHKRMAKELV